MMSVFAIVLVALLGPSAQVHEGSMPGWICQVVLWVQSDPVPGDSFPGLEAVWDNSFLDLVVRSSISLA